MNIIEMEVFDYSLIKNCRHYSGHTIEIANAAAQALTGNNLSSKHFALFDADIPSNQLKDSMWDIPKKFVSPPAELIEDYNKLRNSIGLPALSDVGDVEVLKLGVVM